MNYNFTDPEKITAINFYRLKLVDKNGLFGYSSAIAVSNKNIDFEIKSITNPVTSYVNIEYILPKDGKVIIYLQDIFGKNIHHYELRGSKGLNKGNLDNLNDLPTGIYIMCASYNNTVINKRFVKMK